MSGGARRRRRRSLKVRSCGGVVRHCHKHIHSIDTTAIEAISKTTVKTHSCIPEQRFCYVYEPYLKGVVILFTQSVLRECTIDRIFFQIKQIYISLFSFLLVMKINEL